MDETVGKWVSLGTLNIWAFFIKKKKKKHVKISDIVQLVYSLWFGRPASIQRGS